MPRSSRPSGSARYLGRWFRGAESRLAGRGRGRRDRRARTRPQRARARAAHARAASARAAPVRPHRPAARGRAVARVHRTAHAPRGAGVLREGSADLPAHLEPLPVGDQVDELREIAAHVGRAAIEYREPAAYVQGLDRAASRADRRRREGDRSPRARADGREARSLGARRRRPAHLRHGRAALPRGLLPARRVREHHRDHRGRGRDVPLAWAGAGRGGLARRVRRAAERRGAGPRGRREPGRRRRRAGAAATARGRAGPLRAGREPGTRDEAAPSTRRGIAARCHGGSRQADRRRRSPRGDQGLGPRHARDPRRDDRAPDRGRLRRARRSQPAAHDRRGSRSSTCSASTC